MLRTKSICAKVGAEKVRVAISLTRVVSLEDELAVW